MKFKHGTRRRALEYEKDWVERWKQDKTFEKSVESRPEDNRYVFYDGPPFISGVPHHGTLLSSIVKDAVPRYQTMKGKRVERVWGWDAHGLPAERYTEKKLNIHSRQEVLEYGIERYINATRENMLQTSSAWEDVVDRVGRWVDFKGAYKTMDKDYMESVWWAFKTLYDKGKIYEGEKVLMYCTLDGTPLSKAEVTMDAGAYQDVTDPSVYVKFEIFNSQNHQFNLDVSKRIYLLAWTTTPWTLPANMALAVNPDMKYSLVKHNSDYYILASDLVEKVFVDEKKHLLKIDLVKEGISGTELEGLSYMFFTMKGIGFIQDNANIGSPEPDINYSSKYEVHLADFVSSDSGTGIVHIAPAYGEDDFVLAQKKKITKLRVVDGNGYYTHGVWKGRNVWEINKQIAKDMNRYSLATLTGEYASMTDEERIEFHKTHEPEVDAPIWKVDYIKHSYPHCHRCGTKLMYRAHPSWFMDIDGQREKMIEKNEPITWFPSHVKNGRFAKTIEQAPDWNISRDRFWATAMPVWKSESGKTKVVGSYAELKELSGIELGDYHRPYIDDVTFTIDGEEYTRIDKVMDSWFEAGSMPFAQFHYPFENKEKFEQNFPGDFIVEYIGQVRAWFYYMHAMSVALFGENSFKNVIVTGNVAGNDGRKMSKSYGNYTDPNELMDKFSADSLRFLLLSSPLLNGEDFALQDKEVGDIARKLGMIWNMYDFFTMYAEVDEWEFDPNKPFSLNPDDLTNPLDIWIVSRLHQLNKEVTEHMDSYDIPNAMSPILPFLDDASNWYVRRSRRRFWKSEDDGDKADAYRTLHYVLLKLAVILAPFTPFLAEELYQKMGGGAESVHLLDWPTNDAVDENVMNEMDTVRDYVNQGLSLRAKTGLKVRQPLASVTVPSLGEYIDFEAILLEELNVKEVKQGDVVAIDETLTSELKREGLMREVVRHVQSARKAAGLNVDDRIELELRVAVDDANELKAALEEHSEAIAEETLTEQFIDVMNGYDTIVKVEGAELQIRLKKA
jgi:isoleucyl-tRNA synthetase